MIHRRQFIALPLAASLTGKPAYAQDVSKIYVSYPMGSPVWIAASRIAEALAKQAKLAYRASSVAGDFTKLGMKAFREDVAFESKMILASPDPELPSVSDLQLIAVVGHMLSPTDPFGLYADKRMPATRVEAIRHVVKQMVDSGKIPPG
jgi:hypothetical protein